MHKKILVTRSSMPDFEEYINEIKPLWKSCWLTNMGEKHRQFQAELIKYLSVENVELFTNGHMAIELSLQALNLPKGGEVITTPFTFASTTHAIVRCGLTPVFCDVDPADYTIDAAKIEDLITEKTCAILPVHVYGNICDIDGIEQIACKYKLKVIYDAAHTFGIRYKGVGIGSYGDASCFSFHATKVFNSVEGGAVCFTDKDFGYRLYNLKNFGIRGEEIVDDIGANAKMNEFCAAMGICNLRHIDDEIVKRKAVVERYRENLEGAAGITLNPIQPDVVPNYAYFPVLFDKKIFGASRDEVFDVLGKNEINARKYFYPLTSNFECYKNNKLFKINSTPVAEKISSEVLTLPLYADLSITDVDRICGIILKFGKRR